MRRYMSKKNDGSTTAAFEKAVERPRKDERYVLRLYITGMTPRSTEAFAAIKAICEEYLPGRYDLEVVDIYQHPALAKEEQIIAAPTLVKELPAPLRRLIGNLSVEDRVLEGLGLRHPMNEHRKPLGPLP
jgi:circadian clock protein KaiB